MQSKTVFVHTIAQWIGLRLPSCGPGFDYQAQNLRFYILILYYICHCAEKRIKINKKRPGLAHFLEKMKTVKAVKGQLTKAEDHEERDVDDELPDRGADDDLAIVGRVHLPGRPQPFKTNNP